MSATCARRTTASRTRHGCLCRKRSTTRRTRRARLFRPRHCGERLPDTLAAATRRQQLVYNEGPDHENTRVVLKSFSDFVELCERKERETGEPCSIVASY